MEYGVAMVLAFLLAAVLGQIPLFRETVVGKLHASDLVQFIGYAGALAIGWIGAYQLMKNPPEEWSGMSPYLVMVLPLVTLFAVSVSYGVLLFALAPFLGKSGQAIYNWIFIAAIVASSIWLIFSWVQKCAPLAAVAEARRLRKAA
jgi:hypothetical protein